MSRTATRTRATKETSIEISIDLDGTGTTQVSTGIPFYDHMLDQLGRHGGMDLKVVASGDLDIDAHHTVEDVGIVLGQLFGQARAVELRFLRLRVDQLGAAQGTKVVSASIVALA